MSAEADRLLADLRVEVDRMAAELAAAHARIAELEGQEPAPPPAGTLGIVGPTAEGTSLRVGPAWNGLSPTAWRFGRDGTDDGGYPADGSGWTSDDLPAEQATAQLTGMGPGATTTEVFVETDRDGRVPAAVAIPAPAPGPSPTPTPSPGSGPQLPAYQGLRVGGYWGNLNQDAFSLMFEFESVTGLEILDMQVYCSADGGIDGIPSPWQMDPLVGWLTADPRRRAVVSVPMLPKSLAGRYDLVDVDRAHVALARYFVDRGVADRIIWRHGWEMNLRGYPWGPDYPSSDGVRFVDCWDRQIPKIWEVHPFPIEWCPVWWPPGPNPGDPAGASLFPDPDLVTIVGGDIYPWWYGSTWAERREMMLHGPEGLNYWASFAAQHGKRLAISECNVTARWAANGTGSGDEPGFVHLMADFAEQHQLDHVTIFDVEVDIGTRLVHNPLATAAYVERFGGA